MLRTCISKEWNFSSSVQKGVQLVDLPHDYIVGQARSANAAGGAGNGYFPDGDGRYVKFLNFEDAAHRILDIDGAYMLAEIRLNGNFLANHPYGYTPFLVDLTSGLRLNIPNKLEIKTLTPQPSCRWYSGGGLYRDVFLWTGGDVRIEPRDVFVTTKELYQDAALLQISYTITPDISANVTVKSSVEGLFEDTRKIPVIAGKKERMEFTVKVDNPLLWDVESPNLYMLHTQLAVEGEITDVSETTFGIRMIAVDATHGFRLNGRSIKMRGGCIHHDHGVLGAASFPVAEERKIRKLKEVGFNAVRTAHNPPSSAMLEACDRLGMLVMDEAFDMWNNPKSNYDYHLWFGDWCKRDISYMVLRDRIHPCVVSYSIGNEISEAGGDLRGPAIARMLAEEVRKYDTTRPVTSAANPYWIMPETSDPEEYKAHFYDNYPDGAIEGAIGTSWDLRTEQYFASHDMAGYNYLCFRYQHDHERYPERVFWGSETLQYLNDTNNAFDSWKLTKENDYIIGDFTWTAYDNLGEAGAGRGMWESEGQMAYFAPSLQPYPWRTCWQGDLDLCGYRTPSSYFRETIWFEDTEPVIFTTHPCHYGEAYTGGGWHWQDVHHTWTFEDEYLGKPVKAEVYTMADEVHWYINGTYLGSSQPVKAIATFDIPYEKGVVSVEAIRQGRVVGQSSLHTVGIPAKIQVTPERDTLMADRRDLAYFQIQLTDAEGNLVLGEHELTCTVSGGELMGVFSANPCNEDEYTSPKCHAFEGRALAIVRTGQPGQVSVTIEAEGLVSGVAMVTANM